MRVEGHGLRVAGHELRVAGDGLRAAGRVFQLLYVCLLSLYVFSVFFGGFGPRGASLD